VAFPGRQTNYSWLVGVMSTGNYFYDMIIQQLVILLLFAGAVAYLGRMVYRSFQAKHACSTGCSKCGAIDFDKIEKEIAKKGL
jgi:hypothetical protein